MAEPFLSEIRVFPFNFPPKGWALCNGQLLPINQNQALFALLGTTFGGDGRTNFALPNLRGQVPIHAGNGHTLGETAGASSVTLTAQHMPAHSHGVNAVSGAGTRPIAEGAFLANGGSDFYTPPANPTPMAPDAVANVGGNQPHNNTMPYLVFNFCIALTGIFPSRN